MKEKNTISLLESILVSVFVGLVFYEGGCGWAMLLKKSRTEQQRLGKKNLLVFVAELGLLFLLALVLHPGDNFSPQWYDPIMLVFYWMLAHLFFSVVGMLIGYTSMNKSK